MGAARPWESSPVAPGHCPLYEDCRAEVNQRSPFLHLVDASRGPAGSGARHRALVDLEDNWNLMLDGTDPGARLGSTPAFPCPTL